MNALKSLKPLQAVPRINSHLVPVKGILGRHSTSEVGYIAPELV